LAAAASVFSGGTLQPPWDSCGTGAAGANGSATADACVGVGVYADRLAFAFHYAAGSAFVFDEPTVMAEADAVASPKVVDYTAASAGGGREGGFTVVFDCQHPSLAVSRAAVGGERAGVDVPPAVRAGAKAAASAKAGSRRVAAPAAAPSPEPFRATLVTVALPLFADVKAVFSLRKTCGHGVHPYATLGYYSDPLTGAPTGTGAASGMAVGIDAATPPLAIGAGDASTALYMGVRPPGGSQEFYRPVVTSSAPDAVRVDARGHVFGGVLVPGTPVNLPLLYDCVGAATADVTVSVPLPPWEPLTARLTKACAGGGASGLAVGASSYDAPDVVAAGSVTPAWSASVDALAAGLADGAAGNASAPHLTVFGATEPAYKDFFLSVGAPPGGGGPAAADAAAVSVGAPVLTATRPHVLAASIGVPVGQSRYYLPPTGGRLVRGGRTRLRVRLTCLRAGRSAVLVALPTRHFANVEWAFVRDCAAPGRVRHSAFLRTAGSVMGVLTAALAAAVLGGAAWACARAVGGDKGPPAAVGGGGGGRTGPEGRHYMPVVVRG